MKLLFGKPLDTPTFADLVDAMPDREFQRSTRSTLALLAWWKDPTRVQGLVESLGLSMAQHTTARFESPERAGCSTCKGRGKASFTDVMLELGDDVVAIEAKRTERLYETVKRWLRKDASANREAVLAHWLHCCLELDGPTERYENLVYQMVHRTASARRAAGTRRAHVVHLLFGDEHVADYVRESERAAALLAPNGEPRFHVVVVPTEEERDLLASVAASDDDDGADRVREALLADRPLFRFEAASVRWSR